MGCGIGLQMQFVFIIVYFHGKNWSMFEKFMQVTSSSHAQETALLFSLLFEFVLVSCILTQGHIE